MPPTYSDSSSVHFEGSTEYIGSIDPSFQKWLDKYIKKYTLKKEGIDPKNTQPLFRKED